MRLVKSPRVFTHIDCENMGVCKQFQHFFEYRKLEQSRHAVYVKHMHVLQSGNSSDCLQAHFRHRLRGRLKVSPHARDVRYPSRVRLCLDGLHALFSFGFNHQNMFGFVILLRHSFSSCAVSRHSSIPLSGSQRRLVLSLSAGPTLPQPLYCAVPCPAREMVGFYSLHVVSAFVQPDQTPSLRKY